MESTPTAAVRREQIVRSALELYERKGIERTSVKDITEAAGITRSLFYHYFNRKEDVTDAILDRYADGFIQAVREWNESRTHLDVTGSLRGCVRLLRTQLFERDAFRELLLKDENASLYLQFLRRASGAVARYLTDTTAEEYARFHKVEISHVYETFYLLVFGLIGYLRQHPDTDDDVVADLIAETLHLDL